VRELIIYLLDWSFIASITLTWTWYICSRWLRWDYELMNHLQI